MFFNGSSLVFSIQSTFWKQISFDFIMFSLITCVVVFYFRLQAFHFLIVDVFYFGSNTSFSHTHVLYIV